MSLRVVIAIALAVGCGANAAASHRLPDVQVEIVDESGRQFEQFPTRTRTRTRTRGGGAAYRAYLQAERGASYRIRVHNGTGERVGVVIAVDGRNIISGARSELTRGEPMYILAPWAQQEYSGWRTNLNDVHEFYFTDWEDSYAEAFGDRSAKGVIAVAVYREKERPLELHRRPYSKDSPAAPAPGRADERSASSKHAAEPGTGFGDRRHEPATRVAFNAESRASSRLFLKYEWPETLCRKRIADCASDRNRFWDEDLAFAPYPRRR